MDTGWDTSEETLARAYGEVVDNKGTRRLEAEMKKKPKEATSPKPSPGLCHICGCAFKEKDFSIYFTINGEVSEALAHDECLELLRHGMWKDKPLFKLGYKIWGENNDTL